MRSATLPAKREKIRNLILPAANAAEGGVVEGGKIGAGIVPRLGEVSFAHNGLLFLDELLEFPHSLLEVMHQPLEGSYRHYRPRLDVAQLPNALHSGCGNESVSLWIFQ